MDVLRTVVSFLGNMEPEESYRGDKKTEVPQKICIRLVALYAPCLLYWHHFHKSGRRIKGFTGKTDTCAVNFLKLLYNDDRKIDELLIKTIDVSLILYAEHEFNASTFAARVTTSTNADVYSAIAGAIGTLRGNLHGGANEAAMEYLKDLRSVEQAQKFIEKIFQEKKLLMGFGHRVYKNGDPRNGIIK